MTFHTKPQGGAPIAIATFLICMKIATSCVALLHYPQLLAADHFCSLDAGTSRKAPQPHVEL